MPKANKSKRSTREGSRGAAPTKMGKNGTKMDGNRVRLSYNPVPETVVRLRDPSLVRRFMRVSLLSWDAEALHYRTPEGTGWPSAGRGLWVQDLTGHLTGAVWIGLRAPTTGLTDRISVDIDLQPKPARGVLPTVEQLADRDRRYWLVRHAFGVAHKPFVFETPSGGLRLLYRIPEQPLAGLIDNLRTGLVADVLRAAGGIDAVGDGSIEIFPQPRKVDRLPLGRGCPILCPDTLTVVVEAARAMGRRPISEFDQGRLEQGLGLLEAWHAAPLESLVPHLRTLDRVPAGSVAPARKNSEPHARAEQVAVPLADEGSVHWRGGDGACAAPGDEDVTDWGTIEIRTYELIAPGTRHRIEWLQGLAMALGPSAFGLDPSAPDAQYARRLATWLCESHNDLSREWQAAVRREGSVDGAIDYFTRRYLAPSGRDGSHMIRRLRRVAAAVAPGRRGVRLLGVVERALYLHAVRGLCGAARFRAEVWVLAFARLVKKFYMCQRDRGEPLEVETRDDGTQWVVLRIASKCLERLPYGKGHEQPSSRVPERRGRPKGRRGSATPPPGSARHDAPPSRYCQYLALLCVAGILEDLGGEELPVVGNAAVPGGRKAGLARRYAVRLPIATVTAGEVGVDLGALCAALRKAKLKSYGRRGIGLDEALHCLAIASDRRADLKSYGKDRQRAILRVAAELAEHGWGAYRSVP